jgi:beta-galactosidase
MNKYKVKWHLKLCVFALCVFSAGQARAATARFEKVRVFAGAENVRVEWVVRTDEALAGVEVTGRIVQSDGGNELWAGALGTLDVATDTPGTSQKTIAGLKPKLWSPVSPILYNLIITTKQKGSILATETVRFGFRSFENRDGQFFLNGRPIFLRGIAINPPGRGIPAAVGETRKFAESYVGFLKSHNVNTIRLEHDSQVWFDVCDELGMLVYQGVYGPPPDGSRTDPPEDFEKSIASYKRIFGDYARHPSIVIYILSNEMPYQGKRGESFTAFLSRAYDRLREWDSTRLYIGNAGFGEGRSGDVRDVHRYWGWYYNTFLTYYNLRNKDLFGDPAKVQPFTFTESVGNFTGPRGDYNIVFRKQLAPQLNWTGHSANQVDDALNYQSCVVKEATESFRRLRPINKHLAGIMPFTILFYNWNGIKSFEEMRPKPAMEQMATSYQPILLSWEMWTPQVYAGSKIQAIAHIINDSDDGSELSGSTLAYQVRDKSAKSVLNGEIKLPVIAYYGTWQQPITLELPQGLATGDYVITGQILRGSEAVSRNEAPLFVASADWRKMSSVRGVQLYDPSGRTAEALNRLNVTVTQADLARLDPATALIIGEGSWDGKLLAARDRLKTFVAAGGRILCLAQDKDKFDTSWLPVPVEMLSSSANDPTYTPASRPFRDNMNVNPERPLHPVFEALDRHRLALWSDYANWNQTKAGFPQVYPVTHGFRLKEAESLSRTAILADYDRGLEGIALAEFFAGKGSVLFSAFDLVNRVGLDPAADRLLHNLVIFAASTEGHDVHPLIEQPINWGDYSSEKGLITGPINGLVVNAEWIAPPTNPNAKPLTQDEGAWNTKPGDQFVPRGRRPFGPYGYTTAASIKELNPKSQDGEGVFWVHLPAGRKEAVTRVENPSRSDAELIVEINGVSQTKSSMIAAGKTVTIRTPIPNGATDVSVRYKGRKDLVLLQTAFE